ARFGYICCKYNPAAVAWPGREYTVLFLTADIGVQGENIGRVGKRQLAEFIGYAVNLGPSRKEYKNIALVLAVSALHSLNHSVIYKAGFKLLAVPDLYRELTPGAAYNLCIAH